MRRPSSVLVVVALALVVLMGEPQRADAQGPADYCVPGATELDPADVPPGGSTPTRKRGIRQGWMRVEGVRTPLLESGPKGKRTAVVFLHGVLGSSQDWLDIMARAGRNGQRAIAFDLPGFGRAAPTWDFRHTFSSYTRWFRRALSKLGIRRAHLVFHDIAGPIGLRLALSHPRRTGRIALIDGGVLLGYVPHSVHVTWATPGAGEALQLSLTRGLFEIGVSEGQAERPLPRSFLTRSYDDQDRETRCAVLRFFRGAASLGTNDSAAVAQAAALRERFGSRRRVLVIWGENDPYLRVAMAARQREAFPTARVRVLGRSGHWPFADDPRAVRRLVVPFIRGPEGSGS